MMRCMILLLMILSKVNVLDSFLLPRPLSRIAPSSATRSPSSSYRMMASSLSSSVPRSFFQMNKPTDIMIESPSMNSRRITAGIIIDASVDDIWHILTDYNNLAVHVPNLVQSYLVSHPNNGIRLFQEGAQKIIGFDFRASLTMDMREDVDESNPNRPRRLSFTLVESGMFSAFDGDWVVKTHSRVKQLDPVSNRLVYKYKTLLVYSVYVRPKGPVPVIALEWRIKEDVPLNLMAMKTAAERYAQTSDGSKPQFVPVSEISGWDNTETLGMYMKEDKDLLSLNKIKSR